MKKATVLRHDPGSAARVVAHAKWQRSRGRRPSMPFLTERNPFRALKLAQSTMESNKVRQNVDALLGKWGALQPKRDYWNMTEEEITLRARAILTTSHSDEEAIRRLCDEMNYIPEDITIHSHVPTDQTGFEARELVRALGGVIMANGAMVNCYLPATDEMTDLPFISI